MANLGQTFDASQVTPQGSYEVIPAGDYPAMITRSDMKDTKSGTGKYLELEIDLQDGSGRKLWDRLNLINQNSKAVEIAQRQLSSICHAINVLNVQDSEQLHGRLMTVRVTVKEDPSYGPRNEVKAYLPTQETSPQLSPSATPSAGVFIPPWKR